MVLLVWNVDILVHLWGALKALCAIKMQLQSKSNSDFSSRDMMPPNVNVEWCSTSLYQNPDGLSNISCYDIKCWKQQCYCQNVKASVIPCLQSINYSGIVLRMPKWDVCRRPETVIWACVQLHCKNTDSRKEGCCQPWFAQSFISVFFIATKPTVRLHNNDPHRQWNLGISRHSWVGHR